MNIQKITIGMNMSGLRIHLISGKEIMRKIVLLVFIISSGFSQTLIGEGLSGHTLLIGQKGDLGVNGNSLQIDSSG